MSTIIHWVNSRPFLFLSLAFMLGIALHELINIPHIPFSILFCSLVSCIIIGVFKYVSIFSKVFPFLFSVNGLLFGIALMDYHKVSLHSIPEEKYIGKYTCDIEIHSIVSIHLGYEILARINNQDHRYLKIQYSGNLLYSILPGDIVNCNVDVSCYKNPDLPGTTNFKQIFNYKHIYWKSSIDSSDLFCVSSNLHKSIFKKWSYNTGRWIEKVLLQHCPKQTIFSSLVSLVIGNQNHLDKSLITAFQSTGTMHLVAVSGMHVGFFYLLCNFIVSISLPTKHQKHIAVYMLTQITIWFFVFVTGLQTSAIRAALMISLTSLGLNIKRNGDPYTTLCSTAMFMLCYDPCQLFQVSFQLSFLAILSILMFNKSLTGVFEVKQKIVAYFWQTACLTSSVQILLIPLCCYYFHQFPVYFLFSNLVLIPYSTGLILISIFLLLTSPIPLLQGLIASCLNLCTQWFLDSLHFFAGLKNNTIQGIYIDFVDLICYLVIIICLWQYFKLKFKTLLYAALLILLYIIAKPIFRQAENSITCYSHNQYECIDIFAKNTAYSLQDSAFTPSLHIQQYRSTQNIHAVHIIPIKNKTESLFTLGNFSIYIPYTPTLVHSNVDYILLSKNRIKNITTLCLHPKTMLIIGNSNSKHIAQDLEQQCKLIHIPFYNLKSKKSYISNIQL